MAVGNKFAELQGLNYVPNDAYLQEGFTGSEPLDFSNISSSGIMSQYPYIYPPINQGGDDGPIDPGSKNYGYKSSYASTGTTPGENKNYLNDIGVGTIDDEDDKKRSLSIMDMVRAGGAFMLGGPLHSINSLRRSNNRNKQKEMEKIEAQYGPGDPGLRGNDDTPGFGKDAQGNFTNQFEGGDPGVNMADGGRAGYFFGGRVNYKAGGRIGFQGGGMSQGNEENQKQSAEMGNTTVSNNNNNNDGGGNNTPTISKFVGSNVIESPFGELGGNTDTKIGYRGGVDLAKLGLTMGVDGTLTNRNFLTNDDIENKGTFYTGTDNDIFNTATNYDNSGIKDTFLNSNTPVGAFGVTLDNNGKVVEGTYGNNYKGVNVNATTNFDDLNNISLSKFSGDPTKNGFSYGIGANIDPLDLSNSNAYLQARYAYGQKKKNGGRIGFKNGGLAGLL